MKRRKKCGRTFHRGERTFTARGRPPPARLALSLSLLRLCSPPHRRTSSLGPTLRVIRVLLFHPPPPRTLVPHSPPLAPALYRHPPASSLYATVSPPASLSCSPPPSTALPCCHRSLLFAALFQIQHGVVVCRGPPPPPPIQSTPERLRHPCDPTLDHAAAVLSCLCWPLEDPEIFPRRPLPPGEMASDDNRLVAADSTAAPSTTSSATPTPSRSSSLLLVEKSPCSSSTAPATSAGAAHRLRPRPRHRRHQVLPAPGRQVRSLSTPIPA
jgi:hypothetical protein